MRFPELRFLAFLARHLALGVFVGWAILAGLLWLDFARLATLIGASSHAFEAVAMLAVFFAATFGGAAMGSAIMGLAEPDDDGSSNDRGLRRVRLARRSDGRVVQITSD